MASKQRARAPKNRAPNQLVDLGIFEIPDLNDMDDDDSDVDDSALESELEAILSGKTASRPTRPKKKVVAALDIEKIAADCIRDISDEENEDDESLLTDPDLLQELKNLSCESTAKDDLPDIMSKNVENTITDVSPEKNFVESTHKSPENVLAVLEERLLLYNSALTAAKAMNDNSKARRYGRAMKTLEQLIKSAKLGKAIIDEDIPPVVKVPTLDPPGSMHKNLKSEVSGSAVSEVLANDLISPELREKGIIPDMKNERDSLVASLTLKRNAFKVAALEAKKAGDKETALKYMKILKGFDEIIQAVKNGDEVDLTSLPSPPLPFKEDTPKKEKEDMQTSSSPMEVAALSAASEPEDPALFAAPPAPISVLEALQQRLHKYKSTKAAAEAEGNTGKVRRLERIVKSYEKAIKDFQAGKSVAFDDLPAPPGFGPIPKEDSIQPPTKTSVPDHKNEVKNPHSEERASDPKKGPASEVSPVKKSKIERAMSTTLDQQLKFLLERKKLFREAALTSKKKGDVRQATEYLRMSKGFDSMIEATRCGLPIDASNIPTPPQLTEVESDFVIVDRFECTELENKNPDELLDTLEKDLLKQIELCSNNKQHFLKLGDVSCASKFEKLGLDSRKDLSVIRHLKKTCQSPPVFHYETRQFSIVQCHTDLGDNDLEITVERGINLPAGKARPDDLDSYVKLDFPIPSDEPQKAKTHTVRDSNNPIFQEEFKFVINRKSRAQLRQFKRANLKLELWSKGGFLRSDSLLGTVSIKLIDLEQRCTIHGCFDLMDGRKTIGGKLEVRIRIRNPLLVKQVEEVREKWLVIGS